jgi:hydrogenase nickel incorporation protein HypA/HybF
MHELSIVMSIVDTVEREKEKQQAQTIESIELDIGVLSGVEMEAFYFAWDAGVSQTGLEKARLKINRPPAKARCNVCGHSFVAANSFDPCPECGNPFCDILSGKELKIKRITVIKN